MRENYNKNKMYLASRPWQDLGVRNAYRRSPIGIMFKLQTSPTARESERVRLE